MSSETITSMMIVPLTLPMKRPLIISDSEQGAYEGVLCRLEAGGEVGWGEAAPSERVTGETVASVAASLKALEPRIVGSEATTGPLKDGTLPLDENRCAMTALDMALHDLVGRLEGRSVGSFFGSDKTSIKTSITVNIGDLEATVREARMVSEEMGATNFKVKIGTRPNEDIERLRTLRSEFPDITIRTDANQGYDLPTAKHVLGEIAELGIELVEQPLPVGRYDEMAELRDSVDIPIMADEMLVSMDDMERIISTGCADMVNIKLMKVGGLHEAGRIARRAGGEGIGVMVGCMIETGIAITAGTSLCLAMKEITMADQDGHLFLENEIVEGGVIYRNGVNTVTEGPGLGLRVRLP